MAKPREKGTSADLSSAFYKKAEQELGRMRDVVADNLKQDMLDLLNDGTHVDLLITSGASSVRAHLCLVQARCHNLWRHDWLTLRFDPELDTEVSCLEMSGLSGEQLVQFVRQLYSVSDSVLLVEEYLGHMPGHRDRTFDQKPALRHNSAPGSDQKPQLVNHNFAPGSWSSWPVDKSDPAVDNVEVPVSISAMSVEASTSLTCLNEEEELQDLVDQNKNRMTVPADDNLNSDRTSSVVGAKILASDRTSSVMGTTILAEDYQNQPLLTPTADENSSLVARFNDSTQTCPNAHSKLSPSFLDQVVVSCTSKDNLNELCSSLSADPVSADLVPACSLRDSAAAHTTCSSLGQDLLNMYWSQQNCDCCLSVAGVHLLAHKAVLSARSEYFQAMFSGQWSESKMAAVNLEAVMPEAVKQLLLFLYGGVIDLSPDSNLKELFIIADMYGVMTYKSVLSFYVRKDLCHFFHKPCSTCMVSVSEALVLSHSFHLEDLLARCLKWMSKYFTKIWPTKSFSMLDETFHQLCFENILSQMTASNVIDIIIECNKLMTSLPRIKWTENVLYLLTRLMDASIEFTSSHFVQVLKTKEFLDWAKVAAWKVSALQDIFHSVVDSLSPDTACVVYQTLTKLQEAHSDHADQEISALLEAMVKRCQEFFRTHIHQVTRSRQWAALPQPTQAQILENSSYIYLPMTEAILKQNQVRRNKVSSSSQNKNGSVTTLSGAGSKTVRSPHPPTCSTKSLSSRKRSKAGGEPTLSASWETGANSCTPEKTALRFKKRDDMNPKDKSIKKYCSNASSQKPAFIRHQSQGLTLEGEQSSEYYLSQSLPSQSQLDSCDEAGWEQGSVHKGHKLEQSGLSELLLRLESHSSRAEASRPATGAPRLFNSQLVPQRTTSSKHTSKLPTLIRLSTSHIQHGSCSNTVGDEKELPSGDLPSPNPASVGPSLTDAIAQDQLSLVEFELCEQLISDNPVEWHDSVAELQTAGIDLAQFEHLVTSSGLNDPLLLGSLQRLTVSDDSQTLQQAAVNEHSHQLVKTDQSETRIPAGSHVKATLCPSLSQSEGVQTEARCSPENNSQAQAAACQIQPEVKIVHMSKTLNVGFIIPSD